jgi:hypothetical protein
MNYQRIYEQLTAKDMIADYTEKHHIIPDCFFINRNRKGPKGHLEGNPDDPSNIVRLTPEAHYLAHQLLVKIYPEHHGLITGAHLMTICSNGQRVNNKLYGWLKRKLSESKKGRTHTAEARAKISAAGKGRVSSKKGIPLSAEQKAKISAANTGRPVSDEHKAKIGAAHKGKTLSAEHIAKISNSKKGKPKSAEHVAKIANTKRGKLLSAETKAKISASGKGLRKSAEHIAKISNAKKGKSQSTSICPHCKKQGGVSNMTRYHFDNCKHKP